MYIFLIIRQSNSKIFGLLHLRERDGAVHLFQLRTMGSNLENLPCIPFSHCKVLQSARLEEEDRTLSAKIINETLEFQNQTSFPQPLHLEMQSFNTRINISNQGWQKKLTLYTFC
ncbi:hypothetical protein CHARACLAT_003898 [Characodon lateralis]|uniref:Uncharacterized protein n=1 Tax=Characodon lateralis TaxID=208331 RepID=A0ABU7F0B2_9TELE|nr:hypothetical protein [Characodon lateralis]